MALEGRVVDSNFIQYDSSDGTAPPTVSIGETIVIADCFIQLSQRTDYAGSEARMGRHIWTAEFASTSTIQFRRGTSSSAKDCELRWAVIELANATVEHREVDPASMVSTTNISVDADKSIHVTSRRSDLTSDVIQEGATFLDKSGAQSRFNIDNDVTASPGAGDHIVRVQIIEFESGDISLIERGSVTLSSGANGSITLAASVDTTESILGLRSMPASNSYWPRVMAAGEWDASTTDTINLSRDTRSSSVAVDVYYEVAEITGLNVQHTSVDIGANASGNTSITSVDTDRAEQFTADSLQMNHYINDSSAIDEHEALNVQWVSSATQIDYQRGNGVDFTGNELYFQIVEWPAASGGVDLVRVLDESEGHTEGTLSAMALARLAAETAGIAETSARPMGLARIASHAMGIAETLARSRVMVRLFGATEGVGDATATSRTMARTTDESGATGETVGPVRGLFKVLSESVAIAETLATSLFAGIIQVISHGVTLTETTARALGITRLIDEASGITEALARARSMVRVASEAMGITEALDRVRTMARVAGEAMGIGEALARCMAMARTVADAVGITETVVKLLSQVTIVVGRLRAAVAIRPAISATVSIARSLRAGLKIERSDR